MQSIRMNAHIGSYTIWLIILTSGRYSRMHAQLETSYKDTPDYLKSCGFMVR